MTDGTLTQGGDPSQISSAGQESPLLTLCTTPKPFEGRAGVHQRNAITSWTLLRPRPEVIVVGDEAGAVETCAELGVRNVPEVARNEFGIPLVSDLLGRVRSVARG